MDDKWNTALINRALENGIYSLEVEFFDSQGHAGMKNIW